VRLVNEAAPDARPSCSRARTTASGNTVPGFGLPGLAPASRSPRARRRSRRATRTCPRAADRRSSASATTAATATDAGAGTRLDPGELHRADRGHLPLEFGVFNLVDRVFQSSLAFDFALGSGGTPVVPGEPGGPTVIPEPGTYALVGAGLLGLAGVRRRRRATAG
jgi:hypothetical protein